MVIPTANARCVFSSPAGVPIMKSPRCGCTGAAATFAQSSASSTGPVSFAAPARSAAGRLIARERHRPKRSSVYRCSARPSMISSSAASVASQSLRPMWACQVSSPASRRRSLYSLSVSTPCSAQNAVLMP